MYSVKVFVYNIRF